MRLFLAYLSAGLGLWLSIQSGGAELIAFQVGVIIVGTALILWARYGPL